MVLDGLLILINLDTMSPEQLLYNVITDAIRECIRCPDDSIQDIWNELLYSWETGLIMDHNFKIEKL